MKTTNQISQRGLEAVSSALYRHGWSVEWNRTDSGAFVFYVVLVNDADIYAPRTLCVANSLFEAYAFVLREDQAVEGARIEREPFEAFVHAHAVGC